MSNNLKQFENVWLLPEAVDAVEEYQVLSARKDVKPFYIPSIRIYLKGKNTGIHIKNTTVTAFMIWLKAQNVEAK